MSGRKNTLLKYQSVTNGNMATNIISAVTSLQYLDNSGIQFNFSGSPVGTFQVQVSADYAQDSYGNVTNPGNWAPIILTYVLAGVITQSTSIPTSVGSPVYVDVNQTSSPYIRAVYNAVSGSGTLNVFLTAKEL
jgi:hypothetical protein